MRRQVLITSLAAVAVSVIGVTASVPRKRASTHAATAATKMPARAYPNVAQQPAGYIDGSADPALIPDRVAYSLLFRLLSDRHTDDQRKRARDYIQQMDLGDADSLLAVAGDFERKVGVLDRKAAKIHERSGGYIDSRALAQLKELQWRKEEIVDGIVASLPGRLSAENLAKVKRHVKERVKPKTKVIPEETGQGYE